MTARIPLDDMTSDQLDQLYNDLERIHARRNQLAGTLYTVLTHFTHKGHPGAPCIQTGWVREQTVKDWWGVLHQTTPDPTVAEATGADEPARTITNNPTTSKDTT